MSKKYSEKSSHRQRSIVDNDRPNPSKAAILDRRHILETNREAIAAEWHRIQEYKDPAPCMLTACRRNVYMLVDGHSKMGKWLVERFTPEERTAYNKVALSPIPTLHLIYEREFALEMCGAFGFDRADLAAELVTNLEGLAVPVIVVGSGGVMTSAAGRPGVDVSSRQALADAEAAKSMD